MDSARCLAMDAQRFDPMRCTQRKRLGLEAEARRHSMEGVSCKLPPTTTQVDSTVSDIWEDHDLVIVPMPVEAHPSPETLEPASSSSSPTSTATSYWTSPASSVGDDTVITSPACSFHTEVLDHDDFIITRTTIRPAPTSPFGDFLTQPSTHIPSRSTRRLLRPLGPVFKALGCLSASAFHQDLADPHPKGSQPGARRPVLQVIVTQTRQQWEQDMAFKEAVQKIYPEAFSGRRQH